MSAAATEFAGSIYNVAGMAGVAGKFESGKARAGGVCFLTEFVAWMIAYREWPDPRNTRKNNGYSVALARSLGAGSRHAITGKMEQNEGSVLI